MPELDPPIILVATPLPPAVISKKKPLAEPPCSKNLSLFWKISIVTPLVIVELVAGLLRKISPPSSPKLCITLSLEPAFAATKTSPETPIPPLTTNAPVEDDVEDVVDVTANPETCNISVDGLNDIVESLETAEPADNEDGVNRIGWKTFTFPAVLIAIF